MHKNQYYFAIGNISVLLLMLFIISISLSTDVISIAIIGVPVFLIFYYKLVHRSIRFNETSVTVKVGFVTEIVYYDQIEKIIEGKWRSRYNASTFLKYSHIICINEREVIGIEHNMYTRYIAKKIADEIMQRKNLVKK